MYSSTQVMILRPGTIPDRDVILGLRGTKALSVSMKGMDKETEVTTWSSLVRTVINWLETDLLDMVNTVGIERFNEKYIETLNQKLKQTEIKLNSNCPVGVFKDNEINNHINSSVYLNNQNHKLKLFDYDGHSWNICTVYTGEIIFALSTLISILDDFKCNICMQNSLTNIPDMFNIQIVYINRKDLQTLNLEDLGLENLDINNMKVDLSNIKNTIAIAYACCKSVEAQLLSICNMFNIDTDFLNKF